MHPQLDAIVGDLRSAQQRLRTLQSTLTPDAWSRRPEASRWSPAECLAHLNRTSEALLPLMRKGLAQAGDRRKAPRYRRDPVGWLMWKVVTPSGGLRTRSAKAFLPSGKEPHDRLVAEFERLQAEIIACVRSAEGRAIDAIMIESPFARVKYNLYAAMTLVPRHQHRHLWQAECAARVNHVNAPAASPLAV